MKQKVDIKLQNCVKTGYWIGPYSHYRIHCRDASLIILDLVVLEIIILKIRRIR